MTELLGTRYLQNHVQTMKGIAAFQHLTPGNRSRDTQWFSRIIPGEESVIYKGGVM